MLSQKSVKKEAEGKSSIMYRIALQRRFLYIKRIFKIRHMDFEFAIWQMVYLIIAPKKVYRNFSYHQETKRQWARDDPAFLVLLSAWLFFSSIIFAVVLKLSFVGFIKLLFWVIFVDCIGFGLIVAGLLSLFANKYLRFPGGEKHREKVEFGYAFDVHLNAFFPLLLMLHVVQLMYFLFVPTSFSARFFGNSIWLIALFYYFYITFLGYSALPFLKGTVSLLFPIVGVVLFYLVSLIYPSLNLSHMLMDFYRLRVSHYAV
ncbi:protein unc-50 homolog [Hydractinia symbiolongicarpus]|uniref:protein unc-50 homolog n=1 Tax=Hydractinia symbiolongicarpus TaxID=13093 RepID=UPI00254F5942|nr:protein unc-50 homolog [Hydractinia symbiolongicarpus]